MPAPAEPPLRRNLPLLLLRSREAVMARFRGILNRHGVTEQQWRGLMYSTGAFGGALCGGWCAASPSAASASRWFSSVP